MKLIGGPASPFVRKVSVFILETGQEDRVEVIQTAGMKRDKFVEAVSPYNPLVKVPVLVTDGGGALYESWVIFQYLDQRDAGQKLFRTGADDEILIARQHALGDGTAEASVAILAERRRPEDNRNDDFVDSQMSKVANGVVALANELDSLVAPLNIGQIAIACALSSVDSIGSSPGWRRDYASLATWFDDFAQRPSMVATSPAAPSFSQPD